jgi:hypothetical protein
VQDFISEQEDIKAAVWYAVEIVKNEEAFEYGCLS